MCIGVAIMLRSYKLKNIEKLLNSGKICFAVRMEWVNVKFRIFIFRTPSTNELTELTTICTGWARSCWLSPSRWSASWPWPGPSSSTRPPSRTFSSACRSLSLSSTTSRGKWPRFYRPRFYWEQMNVYVGADFKNDNFWSTSDQFPMFAHDINSTFPTEDEGTFHWKCSPLLWDRLTHTTCFCL